MSQSTRTTFSPAPKVHVAASPISSNGYRDSQHVRHASPYARLIGPAGAGASELILFHPMDTLAKRLMSNSSVVGKDGQPGVSALEALNKVVFRETASRGVIDKCRSLYNGLGFGAGHKVLQRIYKFGGQPFVREYITKNHSTRFEDIFGKKRARTMMEATAGSAIGIGEVALLPLDALKVKAQANPCSLAGRGALEILTSEGRGLYRGAAWTAARNAPGSFALFGGASLVKEYMFLLERPENATLFQAFVSSVAGAVSSIVVAAPFDVIKVRIQSRPFDSPESGFSIVRKLIANEGPIALFKGLVPKLMVVGPKLTFSFTVAQSLISTLDKALASPR